MRDRPTKCTLAIVLTCSLILCQAAPSASVDVEKIKILGEPKWVTNVSGLDASVRVNHPSAVQSVRVAYSYAEGETLAILATADRGDSGLYKFRVPGFADVTPGIFTYHVEVKFTDSAIPSLRSETRTIPLALEKELDITGDAAVALLYPLGGPEYTVRYVPCCNIFGGVTIATRVPVNPESASVGLPEKRLSDYIVLKPDGLSASTMGMYFDFLLGPERFAGVTPILLEFDGSKWVEFKTYEVDLAKGRISMHCPNGGTFVVAAKP